MVWVRKKPVVVQTYQYTGFVNELPLDFQQAIDHSIDGGSCFIATLEGEMECSVNDWIIRGVNGEFYPCKPDIFEKTYERVD